MDAESEAHVQITDHISFCRYEKDWVQFYVSMEHDSVNQVTVFCLGISSLPLACYDIAESAASGLGEDDSLPFLEAIEFTTDMLISPIEVMFCFIQPCSHSVHTHGAHTDTAVSDPVRAPHVF